MNGIFFWMIVIAFSATALRQVTWVAETGITAPMDALSRAMMKAAEGSVTLALGMVGSMAFFLGLMKVAEKGGMLRVIARALRPLLVRAFPEVPPEHPAMGAMICNLASNVLGLGNAATPFGIRAMQELDSLNPRPGTATNAMVLFLAINTSSISILPTGVIVLRAAAGSMDPAGIVATTLFATTCSTLVAILVATGLQRYWPYGPAETLASEPTPPVQKAAEGESLDLSLAGESYPLWVSILVLAGVFALIPITLAYGKEIAPWIIPGLTIFFLSYGWLNRVKVYESFIEGAREGFNVALKIIPYLVAILVAVAMFRESGAMAWIVDPLARWTAPLGLPPEGLTMAILRPLSGSGAYGFLASVIQNPAIGPDSYTGYLVSTLQGSTETTFYVLAVYFGAVQVRRIRHALLAGLAADVAGVIGAVVICSWLYGKS